MRWATLSRPSSDVKRLGVEPAHFPARYGRVRPS